MCRQWPPAPQHARHPYVQCDQQLQTCAPGSWCCACMAMPKRSVTLPRGCSHCSNFCCGGFVWGPGLALRLPQVPLGPNIKFPDMYERWSHGQWSPEAALTAAYHMVAEKVRLSGLQCRGACRSEGGSHCHRQPAVASQQLQGVSTAVLQLQDWGEGPTCSACQALNRPGPVLACVGVCACRAALWAWCWT